MGRRHAGEGCPLIRIAQVVPDLATFAVDDGFAYRIPDSLGPVEVGSLVRVPLGGRRVRGFVVDVREQRESRPLKDLISVSGDHPVFDRRLLGTLRWAAVHYVAPVGAILPMAAPPNLPRTRRPVEFEPPVALASPLPSLTAAAAAGRKGAPAYLIGSGPWHEALAGIARDVLAAGRSVCAVFPTLVEAESAAGWLTTVFGSRVLLASSSLPAKDVTRAWVQTQVSRGVLLVGTREVALWPLGASALVVIVEEGRRAMKAAQTPTLHVRDVLRRRAAVERFALAYLGAVPTIETLGAGVELTEPSRRVWPLVEVVDRSSEPPGSSVVLEASRRAIGGTLARGGSAFVFVTRRGYAPAFRCVRCGTLRRCAVCGSGPDRGDTCRRCGAPVGACTECGGGRFTALGTAVGRVIDDLRRSFRDDVGAAGEAKRVTVGTERDIVGVSDVGLAIAVDPDALLLAPHYRASEDALRILARVAATVTRGSGHRMMLQTSLPDHEVIGALRHGTSIAFLRTLLEEREAAGFPPASELLALEVTDVPPGADERLREVVGAGAAVFGPADVRGRVRWLVQAADLHGPKVRLRGLVQEWRDAGARVRIDADPIDL